MISVEPTLHSVILYISLYIYIIIIYIYYYYFIIIIIIIIYIYIIIYVLIIIYIYILYYIYTLVGQKQDSQFMMISRYISDRFRVNNPRLQVPVISYKSSYSRG